MPPFDLLRAGLRSRAGTVAELAELVMLDVEEVRGMLDELADLGYLALRGDQIVYGSPDRSVVDVVRRRAGGLVEELAEQLADLASLVEELPDLRSAWQTGEASGDMVDVEVFHGWSAVTDLWHVLIERQPLRRTDVVLPDSSRLFVADPAMQRVWHSVVSTPGNRARVLAAAADAGHPDAAERVAQELAAGVEIRLMPSPPSWFWVADDDTVALPMRWGESWPTSVMAVHSRAVAGLAHWAFDRLWESAVQVRDDRQAWDPLLKLMVAGATLEAASRGVGISDRTGRRRIAEAMEHYGVNNMLALGVAWGTRGHDGGGSPAPHRSDSTLPL